MMSLEQIDDTLIVKLSKHYEGRLRKHAREKGLFYEIYHALTNVNQRTYEFGSSIEGTQLIDSDSDTVTCLGKVNIFNNLHEASNRLGFLIIPGNSPGYIKLEFIVDGESLKNSHQIETFKDEFLLLPENVKLSTDCKERKVLDFLSPEEWTTSKCVRNGPALTMDSFRMDVVFAIRHFGIPEAAIEWISRERKNNWPVEILSHQFETLGCFLVKVGSPASNEHHLEFRISFSLQERKLMFGLNDVQYRCYMILKLIKRHVFKIDEGKSVTSYHCKTCLFYMIERNPPSIWVPDNLIQCVIGCLKILHEFVMDRNCPNYFIKDENMFKRITDDAVWTNIEEKLQKLINDDIKIVVDFEKYRQDHYFKNPSGQCSHQLKLIYVLQLKQISYAYSISDEKLQAMLEINKKPNDFVYHKKEFIHETLQALHKLLRFLKCTLGNDNTPGENSTSDTIPLDGQTIEETRTAIDRIVPFIHTTIASHSVAYSIQCDNESDKEQYENEAKAHFRMGLSSDLSSGKLKEITYLYYKGEYDTCFVKLIDIERMYHSSDTWLEDKKRMRKKIFYNKSTHEEKHNDHKNMSEGKVISLASEFEFNDDDIFNKKVLSSLATHDYSSKEFAQSLCSAAVVFYPTEIKFMPFALQVELFKIAQSGQMSEMSTDCVFIDSEFYTYFLFYLVSGKLGKPKAERLAYIEKMEFAIPYKRYKGTSYNLLAWAHVAEEYIADAFVLYGMSLRTSNFFENIEGDILEVLMNEKDIYDKKNRKSVIWHIIILLWKMHNRESR